MRQPRPIAVTRFDILSNFKTCQKMPRKLADKRNKKHATKKWEERQKEQRKEVKTKQT